MNFKTYIESNEEYPLIAMDHHGDGIQCFSGVKMYEDSCINKCVISEASLTRMLSFVDQKNRTFAIITAYRKKFTKQNNIIRNRKLREKLNKHGMGVHNLVGHWRECQLVDANNVPVKYEECPEDQLVDVIERSYFVVRPSDMIQEDFESIIRDGMTIDGETQDGAVIRDVDGKYKIMDATGNRFEIGDKITLGKIAQAYSQHVKKMEVPFVFEGLEVPNGSIMSFMIWTHFKDQFHYMNEFKSIVKELVEG